MTNHESDIVEQPILPLVITGEFRAPDGEPSSTTKNASYIARTALNEVVELGYN